MFLENCQTVFVKKIDFPERINPTEEINDSLLPNCEEVSKELNNANPVKNLNIPNYENCISVAENIDYPALMAIQVY